MSLEEQIVSVAKLLPPHRQQEILDFAEFLRTREPEVREKKPPRTMGLFSGMDFYMAEDFDDPLPDSFWLGEDDEDPR